nr:hypothetical protein BaRGS_034251 [Batillaria attramentaria]
MKATVRTPAPDADPDLEVTDLVFNGVPVRVYRPRSASVPTPALMHFHGGGWCLGSIYRYSAGGNLAAVVSLRLQEPEFQTLPKLRYQVLLMASLQKVDLNLPSTANEVFYGGLMSRQGSADFALSYAGLDLSPDTVQQVARNQHVLPETKARLAKYVHRNLVKEELERTSKTLKIEQVGLSGQTSDWKFVINT